MRYSLLIAFFFLSIKSFAQINPERLYGTWIKCKATYLDGSELPDASPVKYTFIKYTISRPNKIGVSTSYDIDWKINIFEISGQNLVIKTPEGNLVNSLKIASLRDTLVLLQPLGNGNDNSGYIKFSFVPENVYQISLPLTPDNIRSISGVDTVYKASPKVYAKFKDGESFQNYLYEAVKGRMDGKSGDFVASFIVSKLGTADSLKILRSVDPNFDKRIAKAFYKARNDWHPALMAGKPVTVQVHVELKYFTSATMLPAYFVGQNANEAFAAKEYDNAIYYYDEALESNPSDKEFLTKRGLCKLYLGNKKGACEDWNKAKELGSNETIDALLKKYCN